jgi:hypothetical protein
MKSPCRTPPSWTVEEPLGLRPGNFSSVSLWSQSVALSIFCWSQRQTPSISSQEATMNYITTGIIRAFLRKLYWILSFIGGQSFRQCLTDFICNELITMTYLTRLMGGICRTFEQIKISHDILIKQHKGTYNLLIFEYILTWGTANCAAPQELPSILWNPKVQYRVHKSTPLVPILSHIHPIHSIQYILSLVD